MARGDEEDPDNKQPARAGSAARGGLTAAQERTASPGSSEQDKEVGTVPEDDFVDVVVHPSRTVIQPVQVGVRTNELGQTVPVFANQAKPGGSILHISKHEAAHLRRHGFLQDSTMPTPLASTTHDGQIPLPRPTVNGNDGTTVKAATS